MAFPGTLTISAHTLEQIVYELCLSAVFHGFGKIVVVNGHRETNLPPLKIATARAANDTGALIAVVDPGYMGSTVGRKMRVACQGGLGHADELETSLILHLQGEGLVNMAEARGAHSAIERVSGPYPPEEGDFPYRPLTVGQLANITDSSGALGDPGQATADKGRRYHEALVESLVKLIEEMRSQDVDLKQPNILV
jgi:creatinine amidohydrolase